mgnify:FL=1
MTKVKERLNKSVILFSVMAALIGGFSFFKGAELLEGTGFYTNTVEVLD